MKILLINPKPKDPYPVYGPSLGLCYLSSYLKSKGYANIKAEFFSEFDLKSTKDFYLFCQNGGLVYGKAA